jgi:DNA-binding NtrC family response regulator
VTFVTGDAGLRCSISLTYVNHRKHSTQYYYYGGCCAYLWRVLRVLSRLVRWKPGAMPNAVRVLLIESDNDLSKELITALENEGFKPQAARNRAQAAPLLRSMRFDAVVSEVSLPDGDVEQIYRDTLPFLGSTPIIFTSASANVDQAVRLVKTGAVDYLQKPYDISALVELLRRVTIERASLTSKAPWPDPTMISPAMVELKRRLERLAASTVSALVIGEPGSGKEVIARYAHRLSARASEPFLALRCGSLAGHDGERLLFGEVLRSGTNGGELHTGGLEHAGHGTLFLDEISELPAALQGKLIQAIDTRRFMRVGDLGTDLPFQARILAASHFSVAKLRELLTPDLVNRIAIIEVAVPPLRERQADIESLVGELLLDAASELGMSALPVGAEALAAMRVHDWPANVRELRNRLVRALSFANDGKIGVADLFPTEVAEEVAPSSKSTLNSARAAAERQRIVEALTRHQGRVGRAAESLGISRVTLWTKMKRLGLSHQPFPANKEPR